MFDARARRSTLSRPGWTVTPMEERSRWARWQLCWREAKSGKLYWIDEVSGSALSIFRLRHRELAPPLSTSPPCEGGVGPEGGPQAGEVLRDLMEQALGQVKAL